MIQRSELAITAIFSRSDVCDSHWRRSRDGLIILGFVFSVLPIILVPTLLLIYTLVKENLHNCCTKCNYLCTLSVVTTNTLWGEASERGGGEGVNISQASNIT